MASKIQGSRWTDHKTAKTVSCIYVKNSALTRNVMEMPTAKDMTTQELTCKQCKLDVTEEYSGPTYHYVKDLRTLTVDENPEMPVLPLTDMFSDSMNSDSVDTIANRPSRARPKKQPEESLTLENIREAQLNDKEICKILEWLEDPDFQKLLISSGFGFESKFLYWRWELLTVKQDVLCI